jgi:hypothetical protein
LRKSKKAKKQKSKKAKKQKSKKAKKQKSKKANQLIVGVFKAVQQMIVLVSRKEILKYKRTFSKNTEIERTWKN